MDLDSDDPLSMGNFNGSMMGKSFGFDIGKIMIKDDENCIGKKSKRVYSIYFQLFRKEIKVDTRDGLGALEPRATEDSPCRRGRCPLNLWKLICPPAGVVGKLAECRPSGTVLSDADCGAEGPGFESQRGHGCFKHIVSLRHGRGTLNSRPAACLLLRLVEKEESVPANYIFSPVSRSGYDKKAAHTRYKRITSTQAWLQDVVHTSHFEV
ncbi:hypothetical protein TNCV_1069031 [Trichonephila clavipes]|nr:hypothetical protein TNCV_1069031 [Trichonephila clavipes]